MAMAAPVAAEVAGVSEASALGGATAAGGKKAAEGAAAGAGTGGKASKGAAAKPEKKSGKADARPKGGGRAKRARSWAWAGNRRLLTAEYIACIVVLGLGTLLAPEGSKDGMPRMMVKGTALSGLFFILALVSAGGKGARQSATALGTLVTAAYVFTSSDVHNVVKWIATFFSKTGKVVPPSSGKVKKSPAESSPPSANNGTGPELFEA